MIQSSVFYGVTKDLFDFWHGSEAVMTQSELTETTSSGQLSRRQMLATTAAALMASRSGFAAPAQASPDYCTLGFSTYGMPELKTEEAIDQLAEIGFDAVELTVRAGWDADSETLKSERAQALRKRLNDSGMRLSSLMEHVFPTDDEQQANALKRLKLAAEAAHQLCPNEPPLIQTVLGGGEFTAMRNALRDRLGEWVRLADESNTVFAIKPHRGGVVSQPAEAVWLFEQLGKPARLRMVYDYSHYAFRELPLTQTIQTALPYVAHVAVKDAVDEGKRVVFKLPGEAGTIDFATIIRELYAGGYRGDINCEVSGMVSSQPDYDSLTAARLCYRNLAEAFQKSGVRRPA